EPFGSVVRLARLGNGATAFFEVEAGAWHRLAATTSVATGASVCAQTLMDGTNLLALRVFLGAECGPAGSNGSHEGPGGADQHRPSGSVHPRNGERDRRCARGGRDRLVVQGARVAERRLRVRHAPLRRPAPSARGESQRRAYHGRTRGAPPGGRTRPARRPAWAESGCLAQAATARRFLRPRAM